MLYTTVVATFLIVYTSATLYNIFTTPIGMTARQEAGSDDLREVAEAPTIPVNGSPPGTEPQAPTPLPPAIPPYLEDCEFYYNTVNMRLSKNSSLLVVGGLQVARLTIDGQSLSRSPGYIRMVLENFERGRIARGETVRAKLEFWDRVYVGPTEWLLRVMMEKAWLDSGEGVRFGIDTIREQSSRRYH